jgi:transcriptional regulator with XRE-family HTH domain
LSPDWLIDADDPSLIKLRLFRQGKIDMNARKIKLNSEEGMNHGIGGRIALIQKDKLLTNEELAEICGTTGTTVGKYLSGETLPKHRFLELFASRFKVNLNWLFLGEWPVYRDEEVCKPTLGDEDLSRIARSLELKLYEKELEIRQLRLKTFDAVEKACLAAGLNNDAVRKITGAVMDPDKVLADLESATPHQQAVGD